MTPWQRWAYAEAERLAQVRRATDPATLRAEKERSAWLASLPPLDVDRRISEMEMAR